MTQENPLKLDPTELSGEVIAWDMKGAKKVSFQDIQAALALSGLDEKYAKDMRPRQAFTRACKELSDKRVIRITDQCDKEVRFQFNKENQTAGMFEFPYECQIVLSKVTGKVDCPSYPELEEQIQNLIHRHLQERTPADVSKIVQAIFDDNGDLFPVVPAKGVAYVVPIAHKELCDKVETFLDAMGGRLCRYPVPKAESKSFSETIQQGFENLLDELDEATRNLSDKTRESTANKHLAEFQTVKYKMALYAEHLEARKAELLDRVECAEADAKNAVEKLISAKGEPDG